MLEYNDISGYEKRAGRLKEDLERAKHLRIRTETRLEQLYKQRQDILRELDSLGVKQENVDEEISRLKNEIEGILSAWH